MSSVSPSLVEAAARAIRDALAECQEAKPPDVGTSWPDYMVAATAAHEAVGDALRLEGREAAQFEACGITDADVYAAHERGRLEGAQAEHARILALVEALPWEFCSQADYDKLLDALAKRKV